MNNLHKLQPALRAAALGLFAGSLTLGLAGCRSNQAQSQTPNNGDPANANLAQPYTGAPATGQAQVLGQSSSYTPKSSGESYETQAPAPIIRQAPAGAAVNNTQYYPVPQAGSNGAPYTDQASYNDTYTDAEEAGEQALAETDQAPPPLPEYDQPPAPADDYIWTPGYWNYASTGYYWVPGVWCAPPFYGALWTPPYWGYYNNHYLFHRGYWGPHVGYYGGINYGFGYIGFGYFGGYWNNHNFYYNRAVTNVNVDRIHNYYLHTVVYDNHTYGPHPDNRVSYNGGRGGLTVQPRPQELAALHEAHYAPVPAQRENRIAAASNRAQFFSANGGRPAQPFAAHPLGAVNNIPAAPREQAFNHSGAPSPAFAGRAGEPGRAGAPAQPALNGHPAAPGQPAISGRPGEPNRPPIASRPGQPNQPAFNNRPGTPSQPALTGHPGEPARPAVQPNQPAAHENRPGEFNHAPQPNQPRPNLQPQRPSQPQPQARPNVNEPRPASPAPQAHPAFEQPREAAQPEARPNFQQPRAPEPQARPAAPAARPPAPAPHVEAPRGGGPPHEAGGGEHKPR